MRVKHVVIGLVATILLLPVAGLGLFSIVGADRFRPWIEQQGSAATGRTLKLEGPLRLDLGFHPEIALTQVSLADPDGTEPILRARTLEARLALLPLLRGRLDVERVRIDGLDLRLTKDATGGDSQEPNKPERSAGEGPKSEAEPGSLPILRDLEITSSRITFRDGPGAPPQEYVIERLSLQGPDPSLSAKLDGKGLAVGAPFTLEGEIGPMASLPATGKLHLRLTHGRSDLELALDLAEQAGKPGIQGKLTAKTLDLRPFQSARSPAAEAVATKGSGRRDRTSGGAADRRLFPDTPIDLRPLHANTVDLTLAIGRLQTSTLEATDIEISLRQQAGELELRPSRLALAGGQVRLAGTLADTGKGAELALVLAVDRLALGPLAAMLGNAETLDTTGDLRLSLRGRGATPAAIAAGLEGELLAGLGQGRLKAAFLDRLLGGSGGEIADRLFPGRGDDWILLNCGAFEVPIAAGTIRVKAGLLDTRPSEIDVEGTIDLGRERLDLHLIPKARAAGLELAIPIGIAGSLTEPEVGLDSRDAASRAVQGLLGRDRRARPEVDAARFAAAGMATNPCLDPAGIVAPAGGRDTPDPKVIYKDLKKGLKDLLGR